MEHVFKKRKFLSHIVYEMCFIVMITWLCAQGVYCLWGFRVIVGNFVIVLIMKCDISGLEKDLCILHSNSSSILTMLPILYHFTDVYPITWFPDLWIWSRNPMGLIFNPCGEFRWSPDGPVSQIHSPHLQVGAPGIFSDLLGSVQILKREWAAENNGKLPYLFIPSKTATLVPEFTARDLLLGRTRWW